MGWDRWRCAIVVLALVVPSTAPAAAWAGGHGGGGGQGQGGGNGGGGDGGGGQGHGAGGGQGQGAGGGGGHGHGGGNGGGAQGQSGGPGGGGGAHGQGQGGGNGGGGGQGHGHAGHGGGAAPAAHRGTAPAQVSHRHQVVAPQVPAPTSSAPTSTPPPPVSTASTHAITPTGPGAGRSRHTGRRASRATDHRGRTALAGRTSTLAAAGDLGSAAVTRPASQVPGLGVRIAVAAGLAPGITVPSRIVVPAGARRGVGAGAGVAAVTLPVPQPPIASDIVPQIRRVIPDWLWIGLAGALLLAALGLFGAVRSGARLRRQQAQVDGLTEAALTDALTGLLNRRGFLDEAERELARASRHERPFSLAYADVRGLKLVNDSLGHQEGDRLLRAVAQLLRDSARAGDAVGRLGGDELGLLLVEQGAAGAQSVRRRIHDLVEAKRDSLDLGSDWDVTIGLASYPDDGATIPGLLACADRRLYDQRGIHVRPPASVA